MEKNNGKVCGICGKFFSSGKAIGGHMRSHLVKLPIPPNPEIENQALDNSSDLTLRPIQSASSETQNFRSMKRNFSAFSENSNRESESVSCPKNPTRKRSTSHRKLNAEVVAKVLPEQTSSTSEFLNPEEAAAMILCTWERCPESKEIEAQKLFQCSYCNRVFKSGQALGGHKRVHTSANEFQGV